VKKHPDEELVEALTEQFENDVQIMVEFLQTEGRPIFTKPLTPEQQWERFSNPQTRMAIMARLAQNEGPAAIRKYIDAMIRLSGRMEEKRQKQMRGEEVGD